MSKLKSGWLFAVKSKERSSFCIIMSCVEVASLQQQTCTHFYLLLLVFFSTASFLYGCSSFYWSLSNALVAFYFFVVVN